MQTQDKNNIDARLHHSLPEARKPRAWIAGLGAFIVVLLVAGVSVFVFAVAGQKQGSQHPPAARQWKQVQAGYLFLSIQAAPSNPAVLYACVTKSAAVSNASDMSVIIWRSADFGDHWQNVRPNGSNGTYCDLAISPTNANDVYAISTSNASQTSPQSTLPPALSHSTDGGKTWTTIVPAFTSSPGIPGIKTAIPWFVQQLRYDGHNLYGVQWITASLPASQEPPTIANRLSRLATSADGGHSWTFIDSQLTTQRLGAQSYTLDPSHPGTIYEIAGRPWFPIETHPVPTNDVLPFSGIDQQLFKSADNGVRWQSLLSGLPYGSQVQLASDNPQIIYVGGIRGPLPLTARPGNLPPGPTIPNAIDVFHLQVSMNGGASWQEVATPPDEQTIQSWFASADGHVYTSPTMSFSMPGVGVTVIAGTAVVGTVVPVLPPTQVIDGTPQPARTGTGGLPDIQSQPTPYILSYDPASHAWSQLTSPPTNGNLLQVTPADTNGGAVLWFMGMPGAHYALYRYNV